MNYIKKLILKIPAGVLSSVAVALDLYLSLDNDPVPVSFTLFEGADKVVHFTMYLLINLAFLYDYTKYRYPHHTVFNKEMLATCVTMLLGLILEMLQLFMTAGRSYEVLDIVANCCGALTGLLVYRLWLSNLYRKFMRHHHHYHRGQN